MSYSHHPHPFTCLGFVHEDGNCFAKAIFAAGRLHFSHVTSSCSPPCAICFGFAKPTSAGSAVAWNIPAINCQNSEQLECTPGQKLKFSRYSGAVKYPTTLVGGSLFSSIISTAGNPRSLQNRTESRVLPLLKPLLRRKGSPVAGCGV